MSYSVPNEADRLFREGVLRNPLIRKDLPQEAEECSKLIRFEGSDDPTIPINWRFAESISVLKALEGTFVNVLLKRKYGLQPQEIVINTDHAQLFIMSTLLWCIDPNGDNISATTGTNLMDVNGGKMSSWFPSWDRHRAQATFHRQSATNIYKTKDGRYFHVHGSMNPDPTLESVGLLKDMDHPSMEESWKPFVEKLSQIDSQDMQRIASDVYKQAGTICYTVEEYAQTENGKSNAHVGLYEVHPHPNPRQTPSWWPDCPQTSATRPLAGLKVIDLTRVIAGPAITRGLAELGASVMRIAAPHITDFSTLHIDLNWGKWNALLDFRKAEDREKMRALILEADVVVNGYRPGVLDKYGFGEEGILELCKGRERGIIYARENCYGWNGPWSYRSGWQQISDASCGVSYEFGRAMGNDEPVTPILPNSDYCTGVAGVCGVLDAILRRAKDGGSYTVDIALNYYSTFLTSVISTYPTPIWQQLRTNNGSPSFRHYHNMLYTLPRLMVMLSSPENARKIFKPSFFEDRDAKVIGKKIRSPKPVLRFPQGVVKLGFAVGTRTNGADQPVWPSDLTVEIVT